MKDESPVAVITGSSRGIGRGLVERFLREGYRVVGCSRSGTPEKEGAYESFQVDVSNEKEVRRWIRSVARSHGGIDVVVNNAGIGAASYALMTSSDKLQEVVHTNFLGTFLVSREAGRLMMKRRFGRIINMASMTSALHTKGSSVYSASKAAIIEFSKVFAKEMAEFNVTVNVVGPSLVETDMLAGFTPELVEEYRQSLTLKRFCTLDDIGDLAVFLASSGASYVTGQVIYLGLVV